jgi:hypothetical protein
LQTIKSEQGVRDKLAYVQHSFLFFFLRIVKTDYRYWKPVLTVKHRHCHHFGDRSNFQFAGVLLLSTDLALIVANLATLECLLLESEFTTYRSRHASTALHPDAVDAELSELLVTLSLTVHGQTVQHVDVLIVHKQNHPKPSKQLTYLSALVTRWSIEVTSAEIGMKY